MQGGPMQVLQRTNEAKQNLDENIHCKTLQHTHIDEV